MGFEIDFLPIGKESKGGDCITIKYGNLNGTREEQKIILIDGGYQDNSEEILEHLKRIGTDYIDLLIVTHPDQDHCCGLNEVIEKIEIKNAWMHLPWKYASKLLNYIKDKVWTAEGLEKRIRENCCYVNDIEKILIKKKIPIIEPFSGTEFGNGIVKILSPTFPQYLLYLLNFDNMPEPNEQYKISKRTFISKAIKWVKEVWDEEKLNEPQPGDTTLENESSAVTFFNFENRKVLLNADIGILGWRGLIKYSTENSIDIKNINLIQIPHHGSKHNVGPTVLNQIIGIPLKEEIFKGYAIASVALKSDDKHPSRRVTNAFRRRGYKAYQTKGTSLIYSKDSNRHGSPAVEIPFHTEVEDE